MEKTNTTAPANAELQKQLKKELQTIKKMGGATMPALQKAQEIYGYLPVNALQLIADELQKPLSEIYGVATFYAQFTLSPKGKYKISVCLGTACYVRGAGAVLDKIKTTLGAEVGGCTKDNLFSIDATRCLGCCGLAPVMTINEDVYAKVKEDEIPGIIAKYKEAK